MTKYEGYLSTLNDNCPWCASNSMVHVDRCLLEPSEILARLINHEKVFIDEAWWEEEKSRRLCLFVICNDLFLWGSSDAEEMFFDEISTVYDAWLEDPKWGTAKWCCKKVGLQPQRPIKRDMIEDGSWDDEMEQLNKNPDS